jgi:aryl-alcohol dehydrogenase-like predicted oxidoreductase
LGRIKSARTRVHTKSSDSITLEQAKSAAKYWTGLMDASLKDLLTDYVDAYYLMNADMQNFKHLEENIIAAATPDRYFS